MPQSSQGTGFAFVQLGVSRKLPKMEAFLFSPSSIVIETLHVRSLEEIPAKFSELLTSNPSLQVDSYIVAGGKSWILTSIDPFELRDGPI